MHAPIRAIQQREDNMPQPLKPTSPRVLIFINLAFMYAGGLFIYMGNVVLFDPVLHLSQFTLITISACFQLALGAILFPVSIYGLYSAKNRIEIKLRRHRNGLFLVLLLFLVTMSLSFVAIFKCNVNKTSQTIRMASAWSSKYCMDTVKYACHSLPISFIYSDYRNSPQYMLALYSSFWMEKNKTILSALTIPNNPSASFSKLCEEDRSNRMNKIGGDLARLMNISCSICDSIRPLNTRYVGASPWSNIDDNAGCIAFLDLATWSSISQYPIEDMQTTSKVKKSTSLYRNAMKYQENMSWHFISIAIPCLLFTITVLFQIYEVGRALRETLAI